MKHASLIDSPVSRTTPAANRTVNLLAYVHMRNIYRSTGAGRAARQIVEHLALRNGLRLHVLADRADYDAAIGKIDPVWRRFEYHLFNKDTSAQQREWVFRGRPTAEHYWPEAEVVHCTGESYVPTRRARLVVTAHDAAYFDRGAHPRNFATLKQRLKWSLLFRVLARKADLFHTVSHFSAERLAAAFPAIRTRLRVVYDAVSPPFFDPAMPSGVEYLRKTGLLNRPYVLVPGGLQYRKNADLILQAWPLLHQKYPDLMLVVAGHSAPHYARRAELLGPSVRLTGFMEDDQLQALYHFSQCTWFPSRYEGFGMPVVEAMACGTAVVASTSGSIPEIAGDAAVLADPNSAPANVEAIASLLDDARLRASFCQKGKNHAQRYTWAAAAQQLHELYAGVA